jgi:hypothetical protein
MVRSVFCTPLSTGDPRSVEPVEKSSCDSKNSFRTNFTIHRRIQPRGGTEILTKRRITTLVLTGMSVCSVVVLRPTGAPVYRWKRFHQTVFAYSPDTRWTSGDCYVWRTFFPERKTNARERENGHLPRDDHTGTNVVTYESECDTDPVRCLWVVQYMSNVHKR